MSAIYIITFKISQNKNIEDPFETTSQLCTCGHRVMCKCI